MGGKLMPGEEVPDGGGGETYPPGGAGGAQLNEGINGSHTP